MAGKRNGGNWGVAPISAAMFLVFVVAVICLPDALGMAGAAQCMVGMPCNYNFALLQVAACIIFLLVALIMGSMTYF
jgi:NADH:ubiquinone oxidoreductase subunit 4 (subunit M)